MVTFRSLILLATAGLLAHAQNTTQEQRDMQACLTTIDAYQFETQVTYALTDDNIYQNQTWSYDPVACTKISVPVNRMYTTNYNTDTRYLCSGPKVLDNTGFIHAQCSITHAFIAQAAQDGDSLWFMGLSAGKIPSARVLEDYYNVTVYTPPPESTGAATQRRRRARALEQLPFKCETGFSYCATGPHTFGCINTSSNLDSCGACPSDPNSKDCSNIEGADHVECRGGDCYVNSCLRGYQVSPDRKSCRRQPKRR